MSETTMLKSIRIRGFRSLADVELSNLGRASVLIGSNGSGKSNFMRFFDMLSWMLKSRRLGEFVERYGGADDQLHGGSRTTPALRAEIDLDTESGRNEYRFTLAHAHPDRFMFTEEAFRFSRKDRSTEAPWTHLGGDGHREALIVDAAQSPPRPEVNQKTAQTITYLLRNCAVYQFHDTSDNSNFKKRWDMEDNNFLRSHGGNLSAILYRLEQKDNRRFELICRHIARVLPVFDRFSDRRQLRQSPPEMEGEGYGEDVRRAPHLGRVASLLWACHPVEPSSGDASGRPSAGRTRAWLAPGGRGADR